MTCVLCCVWCGVVLCCVVLCGVVWCGVVWCGVVLCGVVLCCVVLCCEERERARYGVVRNRPIVGFLQVIRIWAFKDSHIDKGWSS